MADQIDITDNRASQYYGDRIAQNTRTRRIQTNDSPTYETTESNSNSQTFDSNMRKGSISPLSDSQTRRGHREDNLASDLRKSHYALSNYDFATNTLVKNKAAEQESDSEDEIQAPADKLMDDFTTQISVMDITTRDFVARWDEQFVQMKIQMKRIDLEVRRQLVVNNGSFTFLENRRKQAEQEQRSQVISALCTEYEKKATDVLTDFQNITLDFSTELVDRLGAANKARLGSMNLSAPIEAGLDDGRVTGHSLKKEITSDVIGTSRSGNGVGWENNVNDLAQVLDNGLNIVEESVRK